MPARAHHCPSGQHHSPSTHTGREARLASPRVWPGGVRRFPSIAFADKVRNITANEVSTSLPARATSFHAHLPRHSHPFLRVTLPPRTPGVRRGLPRRGCGRAACAAPLRSHLRTKSATPFPPRPPRWAEGSPLMVPSLSINNRPGLPNLPLPTNLHRTRGHGIGRRGGRGN